MKWWYALRYKLYMKSDAWKRRKQAYFKRHKRVCAWRGCSRTQVDLHHLTYARMGREDDRDLIALCAEHHKTIHRIKKRTGLR